MKVHSALLQVLLDSICQIEEYVIGYDFEMFADDEKTFDAVLMQLQHIGETTRKFVDNFGDREDLPTQEMIGLRNFIAHDYLGISKRIIWETVVSDLPQIKEKILEEINKNK